MVEPTAHCRDCGALREVPVEGACPECGSPNVAICDSDDATAHEFVAVKARDDARTAPEAVVICKVCEARLDESASAPAEERQPCPNCGSLERHFALTLEGKVNVHSSLGYKAKSGAKGKPFMEVKQGDSYSTSRGRFMHLLQIVDRRKNRYRKLVTDPETGEVLRDVDKPLTEHTGHGDARRSDR
jgi:Zn finger protein HypA/HybF involved in hydrogenase expression